MVKAKLFEYVVLHHPGEKKGYTGNSIAQKSSILVEKKTILAATPDEVSILAARDIPGDYMDHLEEVEILVRPF